MNKAQRKQLLELVGAGLDVEAGAAQMNVSMAEVRKAGKRYAKQLDEAFRAGTARLRGRLLTTAVSTDDQRVIAALLEQREFQAAGTVGVVRIERHVIVPRCEFCGRKPSLTPAPPSLPQRGNGAATP